MACDASLVCRTGVLHALRRSPITMDSTPSINSGVGGIRFLHTLTIQEHEFRPTSRIGECIQWNQIQSIPRERVTSQVECITASLGYGTDLRPLSPPAPLALALASQLIYQFSPFSPFSPILTTPISPTTLVLHRTRGANHTFRRTPPRELIICHP
jgi:hypothetical protein